MSGSRAKKLRRLLTAVAVEGKPFPEHGAYNNMLPLLLGRPKRQTRNPVRAFKRAYRIAQNGTHSRPVRIIRYRRKNK